MGSRPGRVLAALTVAAALLTILPLPTSGARADVLLKQVAHTNAHEIMGRSMPAAIDTVTTWIAGESARMDMGTSNSILFLGKQQVIYIIDHQKRTYAAVPLDSDGNFADLLPEGMSSEDAAAMQQMMTGMMASMKLTITATDETKKIRDWTARKYIVEMTIPMGSLHSETWASEQVEVDSHLLAALSSAASAWMPGAAERMKEMEKIKGYPVYSKSTTTMMGTPIVRTEDLIEYAKKPAPAGIFTLPDGYKKTDLMPGH